MAHEAVRARVQAVVDERNELLDLIGLVADAEVSSIGRTITVDIPAPVMDEIQRRAYEDRAN